MSLLREGMLVNGHVHSTGTRQVRSENAPEKGALTSLRSLGITGCLALVVTPCAMVDAGSSLASRTPDDRTSDLRRRQHKQE